MVDILLVEDNRELSELMSRFLIKDGYSVYCVFDGMEAVHFLDANPVRLVLLDVVLPKMDGFAVCVQIRRRLDIPVIILSALTNKENKMNGFELGADDYVEKPVDLDILRAKIAALFKRFYGLQNSAVIQSGPLCINQDTMAVAFNKAPLPLTVKEYDLLLLLVENKGKTLSKEYLFEQVWGADSFSENQTLTVHIKMLRDKIETDSKKPERIKTVWGVGYRYEEI